MTGGPFPIATTAGTFSLATSDAGFAVRFGNATLKVTNASMRIPVFTVS